ncbi:MAG TPA: hypothetical protein VHE54_11670 [Puia sp.]|nr:hypothetical protein [Puia sp.]
MKLTFFLIALFLVLVRLCLPQLHLWHHGPNDGTIVVSGDNYIEKLKWSGRFRLSDDERSIAEMTPGGYLIFRENDTSLKAESNMQGEISYTMNDGSKDLTSPDTAFIAAQLSKMIRLGFFGDGRPERILKKGGNKALLAELSRFRIEGAGEPYVRLLLKSDSLTVDERLGLLRLMAGDDNFGAVSGVLRAFTREQLRDSAVARAWLAAVEQLGDEHAKKEVLVNFIKTDTVNGSWLRTALYDSILAYSSRWESEFDQKDIYETLTALPGKTQSQWIALIASVGQLNDDTQKSELLQKIWLAGPKTDALKTQFVQTARTIHDDWQYGKAMRVIN